MTILIDLTLLEIVMSNEKENNLRSHSNATSYLDSSQIREQAEQKANDIPFPDLGTMTLEEIQQQFHELHVKQIEAGLQNDQLRGLVKKKDDQVLLYRIVTENMLDMVALTDMEGNFTYAGKAHENLGYKPGFLIGKNVMDFVHPEDLPYIMKELEELVESGFPRKVEYRYRCEDGTYLWLETMGNVIKDENGIPQKIVFSSRDIAERKSREDERRELIARLLALINSAGGLREIISALLASLQSWSGAEAIGIRLVDGEDFPYYETRGFPPEFIEAEKHLCAYGPDGKILRNGRGNPVLECMCGNVISGGCDSSKPFFTNHGSFWTNSTSALLAGTTEADRQGRTRNRCQGEGYESVALVPLRTGDQVFGLLQFNDSRPDHFTREQVAYFESIADSIAAGLALRQAEESLLESEAKYRMLFDSLDAGFCIIEMLFDDEGKPVDYVFLEANTAFVTHTGLVDAIGRRVRDLNPEHEEHWLEIYGEIAITGKPRRFVEPAVLIDGWYEGYAFPTGEPGANRVAILFRDITEGKRVEEALRQLSETLEQQVTERTDLAETRARQLQAMAVELIEAEERERQRIAELLHDDLQQMLVSARFQLQAACINLKNDPILASVNEILEESIAITRRLSHELNPPVLYHGSLYSALEWLGHQMDEQFGLTIELKDEKSPNLENTHLKAFLFRAVQELLFNIVKHAGVKSARVTLSGSNNNIEVLVTDQGKGFSKDIIDSSPEKLGFGLISIRERADRIGGHLKIESEPDKGSSFHLVLPVQPAVAETPVKTEASTGAALQNTIPVVTRLRVLFADDHKVMRQGLIRLISAQTDIEVAGEAANGREVVELARKLRPDVIVMDISMPAMDGIEATRLIKSESPEVRIVGLSMFKDEQSVKNIIHAGADAFVPKTASTAELLEALYGNR